MPVRLSEERPIGALTLTVPLTRFVKSKLKAYVAMAKTGQNVWLKHGALDYKECVGDDLKVKFGVPFTRMMKTKPGETVIFSFIVYKSRAHRDSVNAKVMKEMEKEQVQEEHTTLENNHNQLHLNKLR